MTRRAIELERALSSPTKDDALSTQQTLTLIGLAALTTLLLSVVPGLNLLNYPFRLLITLVHELGHGLAAILTGGEFIRFLVNADGSGLAYTAGGWRLIVVPAGYLGAALFGAVLIMLGRNHRSARTAMAVIGGAMVGLGLLYGVPSIFTSQILGGLIATFSGVIFGGLFLFVALRASAKWIVFLLHVVAIQAGFTAFSDIIAVLGMSVPFSGGPQTDALSMAELTFIPAIVWAVLWAVAALVLIGGAIWVTWLRPN